MGLVLLPLLACSRLSLPEGPELATLDAAYDDPQGTVDEETIAEVVALGLRRLDAILGLGRLDFVTESLTDVSEVIKEAGRGEADSHFRLKAVASVDRNCPGDGSDDGAGEGGQGGADSGVLSYTMRVQENGILDTVWGTFSNCEFPDPGEMFPGASVLPRTPGSLVAYDGSMDIYLGGDLKLAELAFERFLFRLVGTFTVGGEDMAIELDFRVQRDRKTEVRVPATDGDVVFSFTPGTTLVELEAGDGSYCCDFEQRNCVLSEGNSCEDLQAGDQVLRW